MVHVPNSKYPSTWALKLLSRKPFKAQAYAYVYRYMDPLRETLNPKLMTPDSATESTLPTKSYEYFMIWDIS